MTKSILLVGVGGQGTILASKILTNGLMEAGYDVKMSEIHGMSQRGGSVSSQVRYGEKVMSPVIEKGQADIIVSFEKMEALRALDYLKKDGTLVVNDVEIPSMSVITGDETYPDDVLDEIKMHVIARQALPGNWGTKRLPTSSFSGRSSKPWASPRSTGIRSWKRTSSRSSWN